MITQPLTPITFEVGARVPPSEAGAAYDHAAADSYHRPPQVQSPELDPLFKLRIGHDNSGHGGSWHLEYVSTVLSP